MNSPLHFNSKNPSNERLLPRHYLIISGLELLLLVILAKVLEDCLPPASPPLLCKWPWLQAAVSD